MNFPNSIKLYGGIKKANPFFLLSVLLLIINLPQIINWDIDQIVSNVFVILLLVFFSNAAWSKLSIDCYSNNYWGNATFFPTTNLEFPAQAPFYHFYHFCDYLLDTNQSRKKAIK